MIFRGFADREVDVVILNTAPPVLKDQVLRYGRRIYERDRTDQGRFRGARRASIRRRDTDVRLLHASGVYRNQGGRSR